MRTRLSLKDRLHREARYDLPKVSMFMITGSLNEYINRLME